MTSLVKTIKFPTLIIKEKWAEVSIYRDDRGRPRAVLTSPDGVDDDTRERLESIGGVWFNMGAPGYDA